MWSAIVDPRVIAVRASPFEHDSRGVFNASTHAARVLRSSVGEHLLADRDGSAVRLDVIEGTIMAGPVSLRFELPDDLHLEMRLAAIRAYTSALPTGQRHLQLARRVLALQATDARDAGASLREIADLMLGPGDWPGEGEHRKSLVRRMIASGYRMLRAGPRAVLGC